MQKQRSSDLATDLAALFPGLTEVPELRVTSGAPSESATRKKIEDRTTVFELLARCLTRIAGGKPLVLIFEDLHSADVSLDALQYITRRLGRCIINMRSTWKTATRASWKGFTRSFFIIMPRQM